MSELEGFIRALAGALNIPICLLSTEGKRDHSILSDSRFRGKMHDASANEI